MDSTPRTITQRLGNPRPLESANTPRDTRNRHQRRGGWRREMLYRSLAVAGFIALGSSGAEAHRYCNSVDEAGSLSALVPDLADERPEFAVVQEATFPNTGGYVQRSLIFDGGTTPICSVEECERYKDLISTGPSHGIKIEHLCLQRLR